MKIKKKNLKIAIAVLLVALLGIAYFALKGKNQVADILQINLRQHKNLALHIHPIIEIIILGEKRLIPANIGISQSGMRVIHTHDTSGKLHIEAPYQYQFILGDFFKIWGKQFNSTCILNYCTDDNHELKVYVNGAENGLYENIPLNDKDNIKIVYRKKEMQ